MDTNYLRVDKYPKRPGSGFRPNVVTANYRSNCRASIGNATQRRNALQSLTRTHFSEIGEFAWMHRMELMRCAIAVQAKSEQQSAQWRQSRRKGSIHP